MNIAVTSIQRNRAPYILEWLAFHMVVGVDRFFLYAHRCDDGMPELLLRLSLHYPITVHRVDTATPPQLPAYHHAWNSDGNDVDWMAFIDGDEFLFPTQAATLPEALQRYADEPLSALAVHWMCYGSSGHLDEPKGLVLENFTRHAQTDFAPNRHVKSVVRGHEQGVQINASHRFETPRGTFDDRLRPVTHGLSPHADPTYDALRINHYVTQSWGFFESFKQHSGAADINPNMVRPPSWFKHHDRNECDDGVRWRFLLAVKMKLREMNAFLEGA